MLHAGVPKPLTALSNEKARLLEIIKAKSFLTEGGPFKLASGAMSDYYLDLKPTSTGFYVIDFNRAYNPTCAYNPTWECPYPPASNRLKLAIRAGEKAPPEEPAAKAAIH